MSETRATQPDPWEDLYKALQALLPPLVWVRFSRDIESARAAVERQHAEELAAKDKQLSELCIIEIAVRNPSVSDYMTHWEGRTLRAEAELQAIVRELPPLVQGENTDPGLTPVERVALLRDENTTLREQLAAVQQHADELRQYALLMNAHDGRVVSAGAEAILAALSSPSTPEPQC